MYVPLLSLVLVLIPLLYPQVIYLICLTSAFADMYIIIDIYYTYICHVSLIH